MRGIVHVRSNREKFGTEQKRDLRKFFLQRLGRPWQNRLFDDRDFSLTHQRQHGLDDRHIKTLRRRRRPDRDKNDIALLDAVLIFYVLFFERIPHDFVSAHFKIIGIRLADPTLPYEANAWFFACHDGRIVAKIARLSSRDWMSDTSMQRLRITMPQHTH